MEAALHRRTFLLSGVATAVAGCAGGPLAPSGDVTTNWPPIGDFVQVDGARIHVWERGRGAPVIMIHGANGNLRDWTFGLAPTIAKGYRAIAFDRPGLGYSERPPGNGGDPAFQAHILRKAARSLGAERPILVGHSWGAALALAWALSDPDGVTGVVAVSGALMPFSEKPMLAEMIGLDELLTGFYLDYLQESAVNGGIERFVSRVFNPQPVPDGYVRHVGAPLSLHPNVVAANKADFAALSSALRRQAKDYHRLDMPIEVIAGTEDFIFDPERQGLPFVERVPNGRLNLLEGVGHMAHHAAPGVLYAAIDRISQARSSA